MKKTTGLAVMVACSLGLGGAWGQAASSLSAAEIVAMRAFLFGVIQYILIGCTQVNVNAHFVELKLFLGEVNHNCYLPH